MYIYIVILLLLFILGYVNVLRKIACKEKKVVFFCTIVFFWILSFIRWKTGTVWESYYDCFKLNISLSDFEDRGFEPFYTYLNYFIKQLTSEYWFFLMICGLIIFPLTGVTIFRLSPLPFVSLLMYLLLRKADIFFVRESIALAFCFYAIRYIESRKLWMFLLFTFIGFQFHNSVIAFVPAYFIYHFNIDLKKSLIILGTITLVMLFAQNVITSHFGQIATLLGDSFLDKTDKYMERGYDSGGASSVFEAMTRGILNRCILLAVFLYSYKFHSKDLRYKGLLNMYLVSIAFFVILAPFSLTLNRIGNSYEMSAILLIGFVFNKIPQRNRGLFYVLLFIYIAIRFVAGTLFGVYSEDFLPFKTIF